MSLLSGPAAKGPAVVLNLTDLFVASDAAGATRVINTRGYSTLTLRTSSGGATRITALGRAGSGGSHRAIRQWVELSSGDVVDAVEKSGAHYALDVTGLHDVQLTLEAPWSSGTMNGSLSTEPMAGANLRRLPRFFDVNVTSNFLISDIRRFQSAIFELIPNDDNFRVRAAGRAPTSGTVFRPLTIYRPDGSFNDHVWPTEAGMFALDLRGLDALRFEPSAGNTARIVLSLYETPLPRLSQVSEMALKRYTRVDQNSGPVTGNFSGFLVVTPAVIGATTSFSRNSSSESQTARLFPADPEDVYAAGMFVPGPFDRLAVTSGVILGVNR